MTITRTTQITSHNSRKKSIIQKITKSCHRSRFFPRSLGRSRGENGEDGFGRRSCDLAWHPAGVPPALLLSWAHRFFDFPKSRAGCRYRNRDLVCHLPHNARHDLRRTTMANDDDHNTARLPSYPVRTSLENVTATWPPNLEVTSQPPPTCPGISHDCFFFATNTFCHRVVPIRENRAVSWNDEDNNRHLNITRDGTEMATDGADTFSRQYII